MSDSPRASALFHHLESALDLHWLAGRKGGHRLLLSRHDGGSTYRFWGRMDLVHPHAVQILGEEELDFLEALDVSARTPLLDKLMAHRNGVVLVCGDAKRADFLLESAETHGTPMWNSAATPEAAQDELNNYQRDLDLSSTLIHGVFMEVNGLGILLTGTSGTGKSELALELISRGHRLIADDAPIFTRVATHVLEGTCPPSLHNFLEVRGLGILNVRRMFGDSAIKRNKRLRLIIRLRQLKDAELSAEARLGGSRDTQNILGVDVPTIMLPIAPGRNLAVLVECAVRDHILRIGGYSADRDLRDRLDQEMAEKSG